MKKNSSRRRAKAGTSSWASYRSSTAEPKYRFFKSIRRNQVSPTCSWLLLTALGDDSPEKEDRHHNSGVFSVSILGQRSCAVSPGHFAALGQFPSAVTSSECPDFTHAIARRVLTKGMGERLAQTTSDALPNTLGQLFPALQHVTANGCNTHKAAKAGRIIPHSSVTGCKTTCGKSDKGSYHI